MCVCVCVCVCVCMHTESDIPHQVPNSYHTICPAIYICICINLHLVLNYLLFSFHLYVSCCFHFNHNKHT